MTQPNTVPTATSSASTPTPTPTTNIVPATSQENPPESPSPSLPHNDHDLPAVPKRSSRRARRNLRNDRDPTTDTVIAPNAPAPFANHSDVHIQPPVQNPEEEAIRRRSFHEDHRGPSKGEAQPQRESVASSAASAREAGMQHCRSSAARVDYTIPGAYANLDELAVSPVQNPDEARLYRHVSLEETRLAAQEEQKTERRRDSLLAGGAKKEEPSPGGEVIGEKSELGGKKGTEIRVSSRATQLYTISYLVFFSLLGTLARLGLQALTVYPGAPVSFGVLWANFAGSLVMGFLAEDRMLFRHEWGTPTYDAEIARARRQDEESSGSSEDRAGLAPGPPVDLAAAKKAYSATKKTIPLYIGLATGFCGSFTSFSSFIRDAFLALSNDLPLPKMAVIEERNGGYSFMALLAVIILTVSLSLSALFVGAHLAIALEPLTPSIPYPITRRILDRLVVLLGWGCWIGAVLLSVWPLHDDWRGRATFALAFAPLGCLARFYASLHLNGKITSFPLGTFVVNVGGTAILGTCWDLGHVPIGAVLGCQLLQGVEDGFCGCLTTVSTWVAELAALRRRHAYVYGGMSIVVSLALLVAIMGGLRWSIGFNGPVCSH